MILLSRTCSRNMWDNLVILRGDVAENVATFHRFLDRVITTVTPSKNRTIFNTTVNVLIAWDVNFLRMSWESANDCTAEYSGIMYPVEVEYNFHDALWKYKNDGFGSPTKVQTWNRTIQTAEALPFFTFEDMEYASAMLTCVLMH